MSPLPFLIVACAVIGLGLVAFVASIWGAGDFTELDRRIPDRFGDDARVPTQRDPDAEEDGEDR